MTDTVENRSEEIERELKLLVRSNVRNLRYYDNCEEYQVAHSK